MILVRVSSYDLSAKPIHSITSGTVGRAVSFDFSPEWSGLVKTAVFKGSGETRDVALLTTDSCVIPLDVLSEHGGDLVIGVYGRNTEGTVVMPTVWGRIEYIREGTTLSEVSPSDPEPDWTAQVQAAAAEALEKAEAVEAAAARGDFDGFSPAVTVYPITGGHRVNITDADHPQGQNFDVPDGEDGPAGPAGPAGPQGERGERGPAGADAPADYVLVQSAQPASPTNKVWIDTGAVGVDVATENEVANAASIDDAGLISFRHGAITLFTLQLPVYNGGVAYGA